MSNTISITSNSIPSAANTFAPETPQTWNILRVQHLGLDKVLEELIDNSLSAGAEKIHLSISQTGQNDFRMEVTDNGAGIRVDRLPQVFGVGYTDPANAGDHNQYGIGAKSVLATCDPGNQHWEIITSTDGISYIAVRAPYAPEMCYSDVPPLEVPRPSGWPHGRGTYVAVPVDRAMFDSLRKKDGTDEKRIAALREELSVTYAPILRTVEMMLEWTPLGGKPTVYPIRPMEPDWVRSYHLTTVEDLGHGKVQIDYTFGKIKPVPGNLRYYQGNITSSGLMVRLGGRLVEHNIFKEVWSQPHPTFNAFLFTVNLTPLPVSEEPNGRDALPSPTPGKDALLRGDPCFHGLLAWARKTCPDPRREVQEPKPAVNNEVARCMALAESLKANGIADYVQTELPATLGDDGKASRTDIYAHLRDGRAVLLEAKVHPSKVQDLAQLTTYGLQMAVDGLPLDELILVATRHGAAVRRMAQTLSEHWYRDVTPVPKIRCLTWAEAEGFCI